MKSSFANCQWSVVSGQLQTVPTGGAFIQHSAISNQQYFQRRAFTLVEVLVSIAIALLLIVGISQIFGMAQATTSGGYTILKISGAARTIQGVFNNDFHGIVTSQSDSPGIVIASYSAPAFRSKADHDSAADQNDPTNFGSTAPAALSQAFSTNYRIHRLDRLSFFARGQFHRQTSDSPNLVSGTTSTEAFIWYGHVAMPNDPAINGWDPNSPYTPSGGAWFNPGALQPANGTGKNDNNLYAASWALGRQLMVLTAQPNPLPANAENGYLQRAGEFPLSLLPAPSNASMSNTGSIPLFASRYDLSYTPINYCRLQNSLNLSASNAYWWQNESGLSVDISSGGVPAPVLADRRYDANPFPTKPASTDPRYNNPANWMSAATAQTAPIFIRGCTQFIVEYAGNFVTQNQDPSDNTNFGRVTAQVPDPSGKLDFIPVKALDNNGNTVWTRQIRWYGFPRDVSTTSDPNPGPHKGFPIIGQPDGQLDFYDVMPLYTFLTRFSGPVSGSPPTASFTPTPPFDGGFERAAPNITGNPLTTMNFPYGGNNGIPTCSQPYIAAWGPDNPPGTPTPKLIRIVIAMDDPNSSLNTEQTYEFVFSLP